MPKYSTPIFDRTALDITNKTVKAFFNVLDWCRIYDNTKVLHALMSVLLDLDPVFTPLTVPTRLSFPTAAQINALVENIENIRLASGLPAIEGLVELRTDWTSSQTPDYIAVNSWERDIHLLYNNLARAAEYTIYCGVAAVGQTRIYQHQWRTYLWVPGSISPVRLARTGIASCGAELTRNNYWRRYD